MTISNRVKRFLDDHQVAYEHVPHPAVFTAQEVAEAVHTPGREVAKVVILRDPDGFAMAVLPATRRIELDALREASQRPELELAAESDFDALFPGCETGAVAPFGNLYDVPVFVDQSLREDETITFNAGTHADAIRMRYADYERLVAPVVARFTRAT